MNIEHTHMHRHATTGLRALGVIVHTLAGIGILIAAIGIVGWLSP